MSKHLINFIKYEVKNNNYYEGIRNFRIKKKLTWNEIIDPIVDNYENNMDNFGPYRFIAAIENFIDKDSFDEYLYENLDEVIDDMWEKDGFELY